MLDGKIIADDNGVPIDCSHCPCQICGKLITQGSYHIVLTVSGYDRSVTHVDWPPEQYVIGEQSEITSSCSAVLEGTLPANGFIMSNTDRWLSVQSGSTVSGSYYTAFTMITQDGSDTSWQLIEGDTIETMEDYGVPRGEGWLIIHCNNDTDGKPKMQVYFGYLTNCMYSDNYTPPQPWNDSLNIFPNNYYCPTCFNVDSVNLSPYGNGLIVTGASLSKTLNETSNGTTHVVNNVCTAVLTYIPPPQQNNN